MTKRSTRASRGEHCDTYHCDRPSTIDFGRHVRATGIPGLVRYLCCAHAKGLAGHLSTDHECQKDQETA